MATKDKLALLKLNKSNNNFFTRNWWNYIIDNLSNIIDSAVSNGGGSDVKSVKIKLTSADILAGGEFALNVAAPGKILVPMYAVASYEAGTIPYLNFTNIKVIAPL